MEEECMQYKGFIIDGKVYVSDSAFMTLLDEKTGERTPVEQVTVMIPKDLIRYWITDCGLLDKIDVDATVWSDKRKEEER